MHTEFKEMSSIVPAVQQYDTEHTATHKGFGKYRKQILEIHISIRHFSHCNIYTHQFISLFVTFIAF